MSFVTRNVWPKDGKDRSHIPATPVWIAGIRILQLLLSCATLGVTIYGLTTMQEATNYRRITSYSGTDGYPFSWFAFAWTFTYFMWLGNAIMFLPVMYNYWVHLGLEIPTLIFWMITMSLMASHAADLDSLDSFIVTFGPKYEVYYKANVEPYAKGFVVSAFAGTAFSTLNFVLFIITITFFGRALHACRKAKWEKAPSTSDVEEYGQRPYYQPSELAGQDPRYHTAEMYEQDPRHQVSELQGKDPRYQKAELYAPRPRAELE